MRGNGGNTAWLVEDGSIGGGDLVEYRKYKESGVLVQALKALGHEHVDEKVIDRIRQQLEPDAYVRILKDTRSVTGWIYETIKRIGKEAN